VARFLPCHILEEGECSFRFQIKEGTWLFAIAGEGRTALGKQITGIDEDGDSLQNPCVSANSKGSRRSPL
jgi:hypothetical protein